MKYLQVHICANTYGIANGIIKRRSKVHQKNISRWRTSNSDQ